jgi:hypothetical protein
MKKQILPAVVALSVMTTASAAWSEGHQSAMDVPKITATQVMGSPRVFGSYESLRLQH